MNSIQKKRLAELRALATPALPSSPAWKWLEMNTASHLAPQVFDIDSAGMTKLIGKTGDGAVFPISSSNGETVAALILPLHGDGEVRGKPFIFPSGANIDGCAVVFSGPEQYQHEEGREAIIVTSVDDAVAASTEYGRRIICTVTVPNLMQHINVNDEKVLIIIPTNTKDEAGIDNGMGMAAAYMAKFRLHKHGRYIEVRPYQFAASYADYRRGKLSATV